MQHLTLAPTGDLTGSLQREESERAFDFAICKGIFSADKAHPYFAGNYMFMGEKDGVFSFKHIDTRAYVRLSVRPTAVKGGNNA